MRRFVRHTLRVVMLAATFTSSLWAWGVSFQSATYPAGNGPNSGVAGDFNNDGQLDLITADSCVSLTCIGPGGVTVLLGSRDGTFRVAGIFPSSAFGESSLVVAAGDFNRDGALDVAVVNTGINVFGDVSVLLGHGDGSFGPPVAYSVGGAVPVWVEVADFNRDGNPDLAVSVTTTDSVEILLGNGDGTFQAAVGQKVEDGPQGFAVADLNGDGNLDLAVTNECGHIAGCRHGTVSILLGHGDGTFEPQFSFQAGIFPLAVAVADLNGDGHPDLVTSAPCSVDMSCGHKGAVGVLLGNGDGTFQAIRYYTSTGYDTARIATGDFDGDGRPDVVALDYVSADITLFLGRGDGTLQAGVGYPVGANPISAAAADYNQDGKLDLAVVSQIPNNVTVFLNSGR